MITKKRNRYYCEHCRKAGGSAAHMLRHEEGCTLNPNRKCRVCPMIQNVQKDIKDLTGILPQDYPDGDDEWVIGKGAEVIKRAAEALPSLRETCGNCPACIMAALRQSHIPVPAITDFDFTKEMKDIWDEINREREQVYG